MQTQTHSHEQKLSITFMESMEMGNIPKNCKSGLLKMKLVAEVLTGTLFYVEVEEDATVGDLKKEIEKQENLPGDRLILLLDAEERYALDKDEASLKDYGVEDSSHIYIFFQPRDSIASSASPSTPKDSDSIESPNETENVDNKDGDDDDKPPQEDNPCDEANEPSASVDQED